MAKASPIWPPLMGRAVRSMSQGVRLGRALESAVNAIKAFCVAGR